jgi:subtilase family serine protease
MADQAASQDSDSCFVLCYQTFNGLTYGVTTGINSDPTIQINHNLVSNSSTLELIAIVAVIAAVAASVSVKMVVRRRRHQVKVKA